MRRLDDLKHKAEQANNQYLMARGQTEEQTVSTIIRGFLSIDIPELPPPLKKEIDRAIEALKQEMM